MDRQRQINPIVVGKPITASPPDLGDNTADLDRLRRGLGAELPGDILIPWPQARTVAREFRDCGFAGVALVNLVGPAAKVMTVKGAAPKVIAGMALDLGTTHLEASLVDMKSGRRLAGANRENPQLVHGDDILSRIHFATRDNGLERLRSEILIAVEELAVELAIAAGTEPEGIVALCVSGNTTMSHFFLGLDPWHLIREPYIPVVNFPDPCSAGEMGIKKIHPAAPVVVMPGIGSYFGGDLLSGILAADLDHNDAPMMLIDVGTNAEVIIGNREWLIACAGAAGPALEGGVARMGMRAGPGAIDHVGLDHGEPVFSTIGNEPPLGICGSGIIDLVATLYLGRYIDVRGKYVPGRCGDRLVDSTDGPAFVLVDKDGGGEPVLFTQVDLDAVMRSKAAMYSILTTLTSQVGCGFADLEKICVAGVFGRHIDPESAITIGMLPDIPRDRFVPLGNTSLAGAEHLLCHRDDLRRLKDLVRRITYLELNVNQDFMIRFSGCRFIPHTDHDLFPSVPVFND